MSRPATQFWNDEFARRHAQAGERVPLPNWDDPILKRALQHFGDVRGRTVVDLGCGAGTTSLFFAHHGANVIAVDLSEVAIANLGRYCAANRIDTLRPLKLSAMDLPELGGVDFVFGAMILHHIEPFAAFAQRLRASLHPRGRAFFWENNARSALMIWFREHVVGRLWVPKHGDADEFPLTPAEVDELRKHFEVVVEYPELLLFRMIPRYLFRGHGLAPFAALDRFAYRYPSLRQYSYRQYLCLS